MPKHALSEDEVAEFREAIRRSATVIVGEVGYSALSMRKLAESLGVTAGALYRYYPSKRDLILDCTASALKELSDRFESIEQHAAGPLDAIRRMLAAYAAFAMEDKDRFRLIFLENDQGATSSLETDETALQPYTILMRQVSLASQQGLVAGDNVAHSTNILWSGVHGAVTLGCTLNAFGIGDVERLADDIAQALIRGLSA